MEGTSDSSQPYENTIIVRLTMRNTQKNKNLIFIIYFKHKYSKIYLN